MPRQARKESGLSDVEPRTFVAARESGGYRQYHQASDCDVCHVL